MIERTQIITEIAKLDDRYLDLLYRIVRQFPHTSEGGRRKTPGGQIAAILREIADTGGLGIESPQEWQHSIREDRPLPDREN